MAWQTQPPQRSPEVPVKGLRARPEGRPGHGRLGVAHTEVTGFTCRGARRSPSGVPCLPRQRIKGFESRSEQDDSYICGSICGAERESMDTAAWARNVGQLIRDIFGAEEEEVAEWIRSGSGGKRQHGRNSSGAVFPESPSRKAASAAARVSSAFTSESAGR